VNSGVGRSCKKDGDKKTDRGRRNDENGSDSLSSTQRDG